MNTQEFETTGRFRTMQRKELDELIAGIFSVYTDKGGDEPLGKSSLDIYQNLGGFIKEKFQSLDIKLYYKGTKELVAVKEKGITFLKNLFYTNRKKDSMRSHEYNIDIAYIFAFGMTRSMYRSKHRSGNSTVTVEKESDKIILSTLSAYGSEAEKVKKYFETTFGVTVEKDFRDMRFMSKGSLTDFYADNNTNITIIHLVGKYHFSNEASVTELNYLRKNHNESFIKNTSIVLLPDICNGDYSVNSTAGLHRINETWHEQMQYMEKNTVPKTRKNFEGAVKKKDVMEHVEASKTTIQEIIADMPGLINFLVKETRQMPYDYFVNTSSKEEIIKWLGREASR